MVIFTVYPPTKSYDCSCFILKYDKRCAFNLNAYKGAHMFNILYVAIQKVATYGRSNL